MAMLSARFAEAAAADRMVKALIEEMGARPGLLLLTPEPGRDGDATDAGTPSDHPTTVPSEPSVRVAVHDNALDTDAVRRALEAAGASDIRPIQ